LTIARALRHGISFGLPSLPADLAACTRLKVDIIRGNSERDTAHSIVVWSSSITYLNTDYKYIKPKIQGHQQRSVMAATPHSSDVASGQGVPREWREG
jgi:hypothetical protein